jgi:hypothetical protein
MSDKNLQYQLSPVVQLIKNSEEERAANAQKKSEERGHGLEFFTRQPMEGIDLGPVIEWGRVFFSVFWLALLSGSLFVVWVFVLKLAGF